MWWATTSLFEPPGDGVWVAVGTEEDGDELDGDEDKGEAVKIGVIVAGGCEAEDKVARDAGVRVMTVGPVGTSTGGDCCRRSRSTLRRECR